MIDCKQWNVMLNHHVSYTARQMPLLVQLCVCWNALLFVICGER